MKKILKKFIFIIGSLLISALGILLTLEIGLRIFTHPSISPGFLQTHPQRRYALKPFFRGKTYSMEFSINSLGLRDYERPILDNVLKVAIFGDSMTFGTGVRIKETFTKVIESKLNSDPRNKLPIQVFNFGVPSYNTVLEYRYISESYSVFKPDMIILVFTAQDDVKVLADIASGINKYRVLRGIKDILRNSYSYDFLAAQFYKLVYDWKVRRFKNLYQARFSVDNLYYQEDYEGWREAKKAFFDIKHFCQHNNITLIFAIFANNFKISPLPDEDLMYPIVKKVVKTLKDMGVEHVMVIDDAFRNYAGKERLLWATSTDTHFSALAHELVAEQILKYIDEHNLLVKKK